MSGKHIELNFLFLKCEYTQLTPDVFSRSPAQRPKTTLSTKFMHLTSTFLMASRYVGKLEEQHREEDAFPTPPHKMDHSLQSCCHNNHKKSP